MWKALIGLSMLFCLSWVVIKTYAPEPHGLLRDDGTIRARVTLRAEEWYTLLLLAISRTSAYTIYPLTILLFVSKTNHLRTLAQRSVASLWVPFHDLHALHVFAGKIGAHLQSHIARISNAARG